MNEPFVQSVDPIEYGVGNLPLGGQITQVTETRRNSFNTKLMIIGRLLKRPWYCL
jgi:hypothetical protein